MPINFPNNPSNGTTYTVSGTTWTYDSTKTAWDITSTSNLSMSIDDLTDVDITTSAPTEGQTLVWNNSNTEFEPSLVTKLGSVSGNIIPDTNVAYDLGSAAYAFRDLYLSGNTINLGSLAISDDSGSLGVTAVGGGGSAETFATETYVTTQVNNLVDSAPGTLDTLNELAAALGDDDNFSTTVTNSIASKLATADFTSTASTWLGTKSTSDLAEGTNLYHTDTRALAATDGEIVKFANMFATEGDLPSATTYHGMFAHVHGTGKGYFAHGGNWIKLLDTNSSIDDINNVDISTTAPTDGQALVWNNSGSKFVAGDVSSGGITYYATVGDLPSSGNSNGDSAFVGANNRLYIFNGAGWYSVALLNQTPTISSIADAGSNITPFTLSSSGTSTVITITATDADGDALTYSYSVSSGSLNGSTVSQNNNVFTVTPHASNATTFGITFTVTDGINTATSASQSFTLEFLPEWNTLSQTQQVVAGSPSTNAILGQSIAFSEDGNYLLLGAHQDQSSGSWTGRVWAYSRSGNTWTGNQNFIPPNVTNNDKFGCSIDITGNSTAVIGGQAENVGGVNECGAAHIYTRSGTSWSRVAGLTQSDPTFNVAYGGSVSISGQTAVVGAMQFTGGGKVYIWYNTSGNTWSLQQTLTANSGDYLGARVSIDGDTLAVSAPYGTFNSISGSGGIYIYTRSGTTWSLQQTINHATINSSAISQGANGLVLKNDTLIFSSINYAPSGSTNTGGIFVYTRSGTTWSHQATITPDTTDSSFISVFSGDDKTIVIGHHKYNSDTGRAYVYSGSGANWTLQKTITGSGTSAGDYFGYPSTGVSYNGEQVAVAAGFDHISGQADAGSVFVYTTS